MVLGSAAGGGARIRLVGLGLLVVLSTLVGLAGITTAPWNERLQSALFDAHQTIAPRQVTLLPVTIVEIDQKSLAALGQWPWPRTQLARLVDRINAAQPAAIGMDILMPESDALSPERLVAQARDNAPGFAAMLAAMPTNDSELARALHAAPSVLVLAGTFEASGSTLHAAPLVVHGGPVNELAPPWLRYAGAVTSIDELDKQAAGWGLMSVDPSRGVIRRIPLVASINGTMVPALAVEMLRVAMRAPALHVTLNGASVQAVSAGSLRIPTEADGAVRIYFSRHKADRFVSAVDVLEGRVDAAQLQRQLVLIGPTAIGLHDDQTTPTGERMAGTEIHAQLLENIVDGTLLRRPPWAAGAEGVLLLLVGALLLRVTPQVSPLRAAGLVLGCVTLALMAGYALFRTERLLFDAATPGLALLLLFAVLTVLSLTESTRQRRALQAVVQTQREHAARIAGELAAAQRIQTGSLPRLDLLHGDSRIDLYATLTPAREVGGDLYDFFRLDEDRLFLLIGDVAGKGLSASIFMAVSKALYKSAMLRAPRADIGAIMSEANVEVSRDNPELLFVTLFAAIIELRSGELHYCNAGHDNPYRLLPGRAAPLRITDGDGPPLCAVGDYPYEGASCRLAPGEMLCLMTDGVTEAQNPAGELYGTERVERLLLGLNQAGVGAQQLITALAEDATAFAAGAEPADDLTILALRWHGRVPEAPAA